MNQASDNLTFQIDPRLAVEQTIQRLDRAGFQVVRSFDLQAARVAQIGCTCPYHGTDLCDCQMVVLLVYGQDNSPITLMLHGHDGQTQIIMVDTPAQSPEPQLANAVLQTIFPTGEWRQKFVNFR
jgi:hypothetical protein